MNGSAGAAAGACARADPVTVSKARAQSVRMKRPPLTRRDRLARSGCTQAGCDLFGRYVFAPRADAAQGAVERCLAERVFDVRIGAFREQVRDDVRPAELHGAEEGGLPLTVGDGVGLPADARRQAMVVGDLGVDVGTCGKE